MVGKAFPLWAIIAKIYFWVGRGLQCYSLLYETLMFPHLLLFSASGVSMPEDGQSSVAIKSMWDNVVSWMKMAVDYIAFDGSTEAEPTGTPSPRGRVSMR